MAQNELKIKLQGQMAMKLLLMLENGTYNGSFSRTGDGDPYELVTPGRQFCLICVTLTKKH